MRTLSPSRLRLSVWRIVASLSLLPRATRLWSALKTQSASSRARMYLSYLLTCSFQSVVSVFRCFIFWGGIRFLCLATLQSAPVLLLLSDPLTAGCCRWLLVIASVLQFPAAHLKKNVAVQLATIRRVALCGVRGYYALQVLQSNACS